MKIVTTKNRKQTEDKEMNMEQWQQRETTPSMTIILLISFYDSC